jgi:hypothetical protein
MPDRKGARATSSKVAKGGKIANFVAQKPQNNRKGCERLE